MLRYTKTQEGSMLRNMLTAVFILALAAAPYAARGQAGSLDPTFGTGGKVTNTVNIFPRNSALDPSGNVLISGTSGIGAPGNITRFLVNGEFDTTFGVGGLVTTATPLQLIGMTAQSDGRILVVGYTNEVGPSQAAVSRFNYDGTPDTTFGTNGLVLTSFPGTNYSQASVVIEQPDGKILVGGAGEYGQVVRYNTDGSLDTTFGSGGIATANVVPGVEGMVLQSDGSILLSGSDTETLVELSSTGVSQPVKVGIIIASAPSGLFQSNGSRLLVQREPAGDVIANSQAPTHEFLEVQRFLTTGHSDPSFHEPEFYFQKSTGKYNLDYAGGDTISSTGQIVVGGSSYVTFSVWALARFNPNGSFDRTFGNDGVVITSFNNDDGIENVLTQASGKIVAVGLTYDAANQTEYVALARYLSQ
jgi:uncharacterized delta-60 repeat protein